jgi:hypothetical protein
VLSVKYDALIKELDRIANALEKIVEIASGTPTVKLLIESRPKISQEALADLLNQSLSEESDEDEGSEDIDTNQQQEEYYTEKLTAFLEEKKITINKITPPQASDVLFNQLASFIGSRYSLVRPFLEKIRANLSNSTRFTLSMRNFPQRSVSSICQLGKWLYDTALLEDYDYKKSPVFLITAKASTNGTAINFYSGTWFERYIALLMEKVLNQFTEEMEIALSYHIFKNIQIVMPNGDFFELDIVAIVNDELVFWVECKSGDYQAHINKYATFAKEHDFEPTSVFLALCEIPQNTATYLTELYAINIASITSFEGLFYERLVMHFQAETSNE